jgi:hypothetical protein
MRTFPMGLSMAGALSAQAPQFKVATIRESATSLGAEGRGKESVDVTAAGVSLTCIRVRKKAWNSQTASESGRSFERVSSYRWRLRLQCRNDVRIRRAAVGFRHRRSPGD